MKNVSYCIEVMSVVCDKRIRPSDCDNTRLTSVYGRRRSTIVDENDSSVIRQVSAQPIVLWTKLLDRALLITRPCPVMSGENQ